MGTSVMCILCERYKPTEGRAGAASSLQNSPVTLMECPRCGKYAIQEEMVEDFQQKGGLPEDVGLALSGLAREETNRRNLLSVNYENYAALAESAPIPRSYASRVDWLLLEFARRCRYPGRVSAQFALEAVAALVYLPLNACDAVLHQMSEEQLINIVERDSVRYRVLIRAAGWARVDALQVYSPKSDRAFVAMSFAAAMKPAYLEAIEPVLTKSGYKRPFRVDEIEHLEGATNPGFEPKIDNRIMAEIRRATFVVVDVTGGRQAVYFEAGFAMGLGRPIIWTCQSKKAKKDMCFDTRQFGHIIWSSHAQLQVELAASIGAMGLDRGTAGRPEK